MSELVALGGFRNVRQDFDWEGAKLELDETQFEWGTVYEIEVETVSHLSHHGPDALHQRVLLINTVCGGQPAGGGFI